MLKEKKMYKILGKYKGKWEELDQTEEKAGADFIVKEYKLFFGSEWTIKAEELKPSKNDVLRV